MEQPPQNAMPQAPQAEAKSNSGRTILIVVLVVLVACVCLVPICAIVFLALVGDAVDNTFEEIIDDLVSPTPGMIQLSVGLLVFQGRSLLRLDTRQSID